MNEPKVIVLPAPDAVKLHNIHWEVIIIPGEDGEPDKVYFALSPGDYENLSINMAEILRWIAEAQWQLDYYRDEVSTNGNERGRDKTRSADDSQ